MKILIIKTGAAGDVIRTSPLIYKFINDDIDWYTCSSNVDLLPKEYIQNIYTNYEDLNLVKYDLVISLEEDKELIASILNKIEFTELFGTYINKSEQLTYTDNSKEWFDMGISSKYGISQADKLKLLNRSTYQQIIFNGLGFAFNKEEYILPKITLNSQLNGAIAIAPKAGNRWPSKNWAYYNEIIEQLKKNYEINILPYRNTLNEHIADISNHKLVISGDSLPMHIALGLGIKCIGLFFCTSPWEIYDYGRLEKVISPLLKENYYIKEYNRELTKSISVEEVLEKIIELI